MPQKQVDLKRFPQHFSWAENPKPIDSVKARFEDTGPLPRNIAVELGIVGPAARASGLARDEVDAAAVVGDGDRVLEMRRGQAIRCAHRPAVVEQSDIGRPNINHWLNGKRHPRFQFWSAATFAVIGNLRFLMHFAPDPMSDEFAHDGKTMSSRFILNLSTDIADAPALESDADGSRERGFGSTQQLVGAFLDDSNGDSGRVIANPAILNNADVEFHDVPVLDATLAANPMNHLIIKRNTDVPGENAMTQPIPQKRAFHSGVAHEIRSRLVYFLCGNPRPNKIADPVEEIAGRAARLPHFFDLPGIFDWNHFGVLSSINREISAKTASRSRLPSIRWRIDTFL